jgi:methylmalonyl-CoA mutase C-terminal domain/subunit
VSDKPIKVLVSKPGLDGHDVGAKIVARALKEAGMEVIYTGLRKTPEEIADIARDEDVDVIGMSILSGSHVSLCLRFKDTWEGHNLGTKMWLVGGNVPEKDHEALKDIGVDAVFNSRSHLDDIITYIKENVARWPRN